MTLKRKPCFPFADWAILKGVMRRTAILLLASWLCTTAAWADQSDPRLEGLFDELQKASDRSVAQALEQAIWQIWLMSEDAAVNALMSKGVSAMAQRDFGTALQSFDEIVKLDPDFAEGWNKRATVNYLIGAYEDSLDDIVRTLRLEPRHFGALSGRGLVLLQLERAEEALEAFEEALEVNPLMPSVRANIEALRKLLKDREI